MNDETFVIYTTEEGGRYKIARASADEYRAAIDSGMWDETPPEYDGPRGRDMVDLAMIALLRVEDNHDFILGCSRDVKAGILRGNTL